MSKNFVDKYENCKWCVYCKSYILADKPYITEETYGQKVYYHTECYFLLYPPKEYKELDFEH